ncbi:HAD family hydrolase [Streptomyces albidoflavus]
MCGGGWYGGARPWIGTGGASTDAAGTPWAVVTSGDRASVHRRFASAGLPLLAVQVYGADVAHAKPAPDCFLLGSALSGVEPARCVVVEDAPAGVRAGVAAGCGVIGLTGTHEAAALGEADRTAHSLAEVEAWLSSVLVPRAAGSACGGHVS